jgi:SAM-dependent methyltransferase
VDRQEMMLAHTRRRTTKNGVADRVTYHLAPLRDAGLVHRADLVLAFWMLHEVRGKRELLAEIREALKPTGRLLLVEPLGHVSAATFQRERDLALEAGFTVQSEPRIALSRALVLAPPGAAAGLSST